MPFEVIFQIILPFHQKGWPPLVLTYKVKLYVEKITTMNILIWTRFLEDFVNIPILTYLNLSQSPRPLTSPQNRTS